MAYTQRDFLEHLAIFSAGGILGPRRFNKLLAFAAKKGIQLGAFAGRKAVGAAIAPIVGTPGAVAAAPYVVGTALGLGALQTQPGQDLLAAAEEHGRISRILFERYQQAAMVQPGVLPGVPASITGEDVVPLIVPVAKKRVMSTFNKAIKAGMAAVKKSPSYGKRGEIKPAKKAFAVVVKLASAKKKKKKAPKSGIRLRIWRAMKGLR